MYIITTVKLFYLNLFLWYVCVCVNVVPGKTENCCKYKFMYIYDKKISSTGTANPLHWMTAYWYENSKL